MHKVENVGKKETYIIKREQGHPSKSMNVTKHIMRMNKMYRVSISVRKSVNPSAPGRGYSTLTEYNSLTLFLRVMHKSYLGGEDVLIYL